MKTYLINFLTCFVATFIFMYFLLAYIKNEVNIWQWSEAPRILQVIVSINVSICITAAYDTKSIWK